MWRPSAVGTYVRRYMDEALMKRLVMSPGVIVGNECRLPNAAADDKRRLLPLLCWAKNIELNPYLAIVTSTRRTTKAAAEEDSTATSMRTVSDLLTDLAASPHALRVGVEQLTSAMRAASYSDDFFDLQWDEPTPSAMQSKLPSKAAACEPTSDVQSSCTGTK